MPSAVSFIPWKLLASLVEFLSHVPIPRIARGTVYKTFAALYQINLQEIELPLSEYRSFSGFFTRRLRTGVREWVGTFCSPVDGTHRGTSRIVGERIPQIKGNDYSLSEFLGATSGVSRFCGGGCVNLYLSPSNYHRVHVPCELSVLEIVPIEGQVFPVNDWAISRVPELFAKNRRVVFLCESQEYGVFALVMVGAANVGRILVHPSGCVEGIDLFSQQGVSLRDQLKRKYVKGEELATFDLGSSVVLLIPPGDFAERLLAKAPISPQALCVGNVLI